LNTLQVKIIKKALDRQQRLQDKDRDFIYSFVNMHGEVIADARVTPPQNTWLNDIWERVSN